MQLSIATMNYVSDQVQGRKTSQNTCL